MMPSSACARARAASASSHACQRVSSRYSARLPGAEIRAAGVAPSLIGLPPTFSCDHIKPTLATGEVMPHPTIYLARHGETEWSLSGQHTGLTDLPLTARGETNARALAPRLAGLSFAKVFTSPLHRASRTCALAGF